MPARELHTAPKSTIILDHNEGPVQGRLIRSQWSKEDIAHSIHLSPRGYTTNGIQATDILSLIGIPRTNCPNFGGSAFCRFVEEDFDLKAFMLAFEFARSAIVQADNHLRTCGIELPKPEGWKHFNVQHGGSNQRRSAQRGDGHSAASHSSLKQSEDAAFEFRLTWLDGSERGWTTHIGSRHPPLSAEFASILQFTGLQKFGDCPEFDFDPCYWHYLSASHVDPLDIGTSQQLARYAYQTFDALASNFSLAVASLAKASAHLAPFGFPLLQEQSGPNPNRRKDAAAPKTETADMPSHFDVAISFAGPDRALAEELASLIRAEGYSTFYDDFFQDKLWGKDLPVFFDDIYRKRSRFCVIFVSKNYLESLWCEHERKSAVARAMTERSEYILPVLLDSTELPGVAPTIGHLSLAKHSIPEVANHLISKLRPQLLQP